MAAEVSATALAAVAEEPPPVSPTTEAASAATAEDYAQLTEETSRDKFENLVEGNSESKSEKD